MNQGLIGLIGMTAVLIFLIGVSLFSGRTLGGIGLRKLIERKTEPDLFLAMIAVEIMVLLPLLYFSVLGIADYLGHPLISN